LSDTYQLERKIAEGGMGVVYVARHMRLHRRVAVKLLTKAADVTDVETNVALERFRREAQVAAALIHPHVVQIFDYQITPDGTPYIVLELLDGEDLRTRTRRQRLAPSETARIIEQVASALDAAHALGVVHRDLKPGNVFLNLQPEPDFVKVLDFGVSKMVSLATITTGDALIGTPPYMSPEQAVASAEITAASDLFGLGSMAYEMLLGRRPFGGDSVPAILYSIVHAQPAAPSKTFGPAASALDEVFARALAKSPEDRYPSAGAFADALRSALSTLGDGDSSLAVTPRDLSLSSVLAAQHVARLSADSVTSAPGTSLAGLPPSSDAWGELVPTPQPARAVTSRRWLVMGTAALVAGLALAVGLWPRADPVVHASPPSTVETAVQTGPTVVLRMHMMPFDAHVAVDGVSVLGDTVVLPSRVGSRELRISAPGYVTVDRPIDASRDDDVEITLAPVDATTTAPTRALAPASLEPKSSVRASRPHPHASSSRARPAKNDTPSAPVQDL
jgi:serine/threonine-protein kinase